MLAMPMHISSWVYSLVCYILVLQWFWLKHAEPICFLRLSSSVDTVSLRRHLENTLLNIQIDLTVTLVYTQWTNWLLHHRHRPVYYHLINWPFVCYETKGQQHVHCHTLHVQSPDILLLVVHSLTIRDTTAPHSKSYLPTTISGFTRITDTGSGASVPILDSESVVDSRQLWVYTTNSSYNDAER